jgi:hypothetical protein
MICVMHGPSSLENHYRDQIIFSRAAHRVTSTPNRRTVNTERHVKPDPGFTRNAHVSYDMRIRLPSQLGTSWINASGRVRPRVEIDSGSSHSIHGCFERLSTKSSRHSRTSTQHLDAMQRPRVVPTLGLSISFRLDPGTGEKKKHVFPEH